MPEAATLTPPGSQRTKLFRFGPYPFPLPGSARLRPLQSIVGPILAVVRACAAPTLAVGAGGLGYTGERGTGGEGRK